MVIAEVIVAAGGPVGATVEKDPQGTVGLEIGQVARGAVRMVEAQAAGL